MTLTKRETIFASILIVLVLIGVLFGGRAWGQKGLATLREDHQQELIALKTTSQGELTDLKEKYQEELAKVEEGHQKELAEVKDRAYHEGKTEGERIGYNTGYSEGEAAGYERGKEDGYQEGWDACKYRYYCWPPCPPPCQPPYYPGEFVAQVYDGENFNTLIGSFEEPTISHYWGNGGPLGLSDHFSVRWEGSVWFEGGQYRFRVVPDDGVRLYVDGRLLIDEWHKNDSIPYETMIYLNQGYHQVRLDYYEWKYISKISLSWQKN
jgi:hypothetical protein